jgi:ferredoxin
MIVMDNEFYGKLPDPMEDENDMLDQAEGLTETSRLGCQVIMTQNLNGLVVKLPAVIANMQVG